MRAHYFQHVPFEGLGSIESWFKKAGFQITVTRFYNSETLPPIEEPDFLIIMGGPMSVNDQSEYPWLTEEKEFIRRFIATGRPVLGICLGAQLIASAMGGKVYPNSEKEIGWFPVESVKEQADSENNQFQFPEKIQAFHWHGETFTLPEGAVQLAKSRGCENQAFQIGRNVIALQFHLETTLESARNLIERCRDELTGGLFIQTEGELLSAPDEVYLGINNLMERVLEYLLGAE